MNYAPDQIVARRLGACYTEGMTTASCHIQVDGHRHFVMVDNHQCPQWTLTIRSGAGEVTAAIPDAVAAEVFHSALMHPATPSDGLAATLREVLSYDEPREDHTCWECDGKGRLLWEEGMTDDTCPTCKGKGESYT